MEFEYRVESEHLGYDDLALPKAIEKYTSPFWPFGKERRARGKLDKKQAEILDEHGIEMRTALGGRVSLILEEESKEKADEKMENFKEAIETFYQDDFGIEEPFEYSPSS